MKNLKCPVCLSQKGLENKSLTHKYKHCNKYFKYCSGCEEIYATSNPNNLNNCTVVKNIFKQDICNTCNKWLPDLPTSWTRSLTNLSKMYELVEDIKLMENMMDEKRLLVLQRERGAITYNYKKAKDENKKENLQYKKGTLIRRMREYSGALANMGIVRKYMIENKREFILTSLGEEMTNSKSLMRTLALFITAFSNLKINNGYLKPQNSSSYSMFNTRFLHNILLSIQELKKDGASEQEIGLSIMARDEKQLKNVFENIYKKNNSKVIKNIFFINDNELKRGLKSTILNIFEKELKIIFKKENKYYLTQIGIELITFLNERPALWYEEIGKNNEERNEVFAKILVWRFINKNIIDQKKTKISEEQLNKVVRSYFPEREPKDIQINLYYDEPIHKRDENITWEILKKLKEYMPELNLLEIKKMCLELNVAWLEEIEEIVRINSKLFECDEELISKNIFIKNEQSGRKWHNKSREILKKLGLEIVDYSKNPIFSELDIRGLKTSLPGGTLHNPDMLIMGGFGPENCILVDAKDENSIKQEVHKLRGYDTYAKNIDVNTYAIILLRGKLPQIVKKIILESEEYFERVCIIEEEVLEYLLERKVQKEEVLRVIIPKDGFLHLDLISIKKYLVN